MQLVCESCGKSFADRQVIFGKERHLHGRRQCLDCLPFRPRRSPSFVTARPVKQLSCESCGRLFPAKQVVEGKIRSLYRRRFCLECSPFGVHNTSKNPPGSLAPSELIELRRKRRNAKTYRYLKKHRKQLKRLLVAACGGRCASCAYAGTPAALDFHHRDASTKDFAISEFHGSWEQLLVEAKKCDLLCANCHRLRHAHEDLSAKGGPVIAFRRRTKARAVDLMGGECFGCGFSGLSAVYDFHHWDADEKEFGIAQDGIPRRWVDVVAELEKCVMLCANCHREVHAGVRTISADAPRSRGGRSALRRVGRALSWHYRRRRRALLRGLHCRRDVPLIDRPHDHASRQHPVLTPDEQHQRDSISNAQYAAQTKSSALREEAPSFDSSRRS